MFVEGKRSLGEVASFWVRANRRCCAWGDFDIVDGWGHTTSSGCDRLVGEGKHTQEASRVRQTPPPHSRTPPGLHPRQITPKWLRSRTGSGCLPDASWIGDGYSPGAAPHTPTLPPRKAPDHSSPSNLCKDAALQRPTRSWLRGTTLFPTDVARLLLRLHHS